MGQMQSSEIKCQSQGQSASEQWSPILSRHWSPASYCPLLVGFLMNSMWRRDSYFNVYNQVGTKKKGYIAIVNVKHSRVEK